MSNCFDDAERVAQVSASGGGHKVRLYGTGEQGRSFGERISGARNSSAQGLGLTYYRSCKALTNASV